MFWNNNTFSEGKYIELLNKREEIKKQTEEFAESFTLQKSIIDNTENDSLEIIKAKKERFESFFKQHKKDVQKALDEQIRLEKKIAKMEKAFPEDCEKIKKYLTYKELYKSGKIGRQVFDDLIAKSLKKPVKYSDILVRNEKYELLIMQRQEEPGKWCIPGGHVDPGENHLMAAQRELKEETGLNLPLEKFTEIGKYKTADADIRYFTVTITEDDGPIINNDGESTFSQWISDEDIDSYIFIKNMGENLKKLSSPMCYKIMDLSKSLMSGKITAKVFDELVKSYKEKEKDIHYQELKDEDIIEKDEEEDEDKEEKSGIGEVATLAPESLEGQRKNLCKGFGLTLDFDNPDDAIKFKSFIEEHIPEIVEDEVEIVEVAGENLVKDAAIDYLNCLEGAKTRIKNLHWDELSNSKHVYLDDLEDEVGVFEDMLAEMLQSQLGRVEPGSITGEDIEIDSPIELVNYLYDRTMELREVLDQGKFYYGEISHIDDFLGTLKQMKYRFQMV